MPIKPWSTVKTPTITKPTTKAGGVPDWSKPTPPSPVYNKFSQDVSTHVMNPLNPNNQLNVQFPKSNPITEALQPHNLLGATKKIGNYLYDNIAQIIAPTITHEEARNPKIIEDTLLNLPNSAFKLAKETVSHPIKTAETVVGSATRGLADVVTNAIINLLPEKAGGDRISLLQATSEILDKYLNGRDLTGQPTQQAISEAFHVAGQAAPFIAAGGIGGEIGISAGSAVTPTAEAISSGIGTTLGFLGAGQTQIPREATAKQRANQMMHDLVGLGLFEAGSRLFNIVKGKAVEAITESKTPTATKIPNEFPKANPLPPEVQARVQEPGTTKPTPEIAPTEAITPKVDPLIQEAKKYTSAEEFVKAQELLYHGTSKESASAIKKAGGFTSETAKKGIDLLGDKVSANASVALTLDEATGKLYAGPRPEGGIGELLAFSSKNLKLADEATANKFGKDINKLRQAGYDGYHTSSPHDEMVETVVFNKEKLKLISKSQLTDIWNKANQPKTVPITQPQVSTPEIKTSKLALGVEQKAIEAKLTLGFEDKPEYATVNVKEQARVAAELLSNDPARAGRIAMGTERPPEGLLPESVFTAVEDQALKNGDVATLRELATASSLTSEATGMGQRIRMLAERQPDSPVAKIQEVIKAREQAAVAREQAKLKGAKDLERLKSDIAKEIKKKIEKTQTKANWSSFVESLRC